MAQEDRFAFGKNWTKFLALVDEERIATAMRSLCNALEEENLEGKRFLDIGSGSGLFSLAAYRLGAEVFSFDYDEGSVACTQKLK
ncbi:MAG: 50S ribosomal protein L11 methyltransferase, partial [Holosporales bacterium]|nr:50S ribosomal protein L11 methyltransferase [Holosporales bacterium]